MQVQLMNVRMLINLINNLKVVFVILVLLSLFILKIKMNLGILYQFKV